MYVELPSEEDAKFLGSRSVSIKGIFEPWAQILKKCALSGDLIVIILWN
jgi:hypothetical protein